MSASKVRWLELSQLSLCSEFDKENSMGFLLNSLLLIHFTTVAMRLFSHGPHVTLVMWHLVTVTIVTLWQSHVILSHAPPCSCKSKEKEKEKKRNINNDLAILPSHDTTPLLGFLVSRNFSTAHNMGPPCCPFHLHLPPSILELLIFLLQLLLSLPGSSSSFLFLPASCPSIASNSFPSFPNILGRIACLTIRTTSLP